MYETWWNKLQNGSDAQYFAFWAAVTFLVVFTVLCIYSTATG